MKTNLVNLALGLAFTAGTVSCQSQKNNPVFEHQGDTITVVRIASPAKYLLLPVQESSNEGQVKLDTGSPADTSMDVRLLQTVLNIMFRLLYRREPLKLSLL